jgi:putative ABC transport system ATP-binding protein
MLGSGAKYPQPGGMMIEFESVSKIYQTGEVELRALDKVSLRIEAGELVAIMGPSGSGKSTMMNILGCLDVPTDGVYRLDGVDVTDLSDNELAEIRNRKIGFVFQSFNLIPRTSAVRNVELPMVYAGTAGRRELAMRALVLADEPTGNLDSASTHEIMKLLVELNDTGRTVVLITHEDDVANFAKRVILLRDGRVVSDSAPSERTLVH